MYRLQFDGLFRKVDEDNLDGGYPANRRAGFMGYGWLIYKHEILAARGHGVYARMVDANSLIAEYLALIEGLESLIDMGVNSEPVTISGDAKSIFDQMEGRAAVNAETIKPLYKRTCRLAARFCLVTWSWTPRRGNRDADQLTRLAMRQLKADREQYEISLQALRDSERSKNRSKKFISLLDLRIYQPLPSWIESSLAPVPLPARFSQLAAVQR